MFENRGLTVQSKVQEASILFRRQDGQMAALLEDDKGPIAIKLLLNVQ